MSNSPPRCCRSGCLYLLVLLSFLAACSSQPRPVAAPLQAQPSPVPSTPTLSRPTPASVAAVPQVTLPASPTLTAVGDVADEFAQLRAAQPTRLDYVELSRALRGQLTITTPAPRPQPQPGDRELFWLLDLTGGQASQVPAILRYRGPGLLVYVQEGQPYDQAQLERNAQIFEAQIYPQTRAVFGPEASPGIDGDPRLVVLSAQLRGAGGYFAARDGLPQAVYRFSNERDMFVISHNPLQPLAPITLAHEFQHMIYHSRASRPALWFNEGLSMLSEDLNGFRSDRLAESYLATPDLQLTTWTAGAQLFEHYGAAHLFARYLYEQYAAGNTLAELVSNGAGAELQPFVELAARTRPDIQDFGDLYADWALANLLGDSALADGRYGYTTLPRRAQTLALPLERQESVAQFGADYFELPAGAQLQFSGATQVGLTAAPARGISWWSGRNDYALSSLTRRIDLRAVSAASLEFALWYELERDYDFAFVSVSTDGGASWQILRGRHTTERDTHGANFGHGWTGVSGAPDERTGGEIRGQWLEEQIDLSAFAGREILLRFWVVNDEGYHAPGLLLDDFRIDALGWADDLEAVNHDWQAEGFARTDNTLEQRWELRLVRGAGAQRHIEALPVDHAGQALIALAPGEPGILLVSASSEFTSERASYRLSSR